jgi:hypothetical protein
VKPAGKDMQPQLLVHDFRRISWKSLPFTMSGDHRRPDRPRLLFCTTWPPCC